jgi:hypothetical protein
MISRSVLEWVVAVRELCLNVMFYLLLAEAEVAVVFHLLVEAEAAVSINL